MSEPSPLTRRCGACGYRYEATVETCPIDLHPMPAAGPGAADLGSYRLLARLGEGAWGRSTGRFTPGIAGDDRRTLGTIDMGRESRRGRPTT